MPIKSRTTKPPVRTPAVSALPAPSEAVRPQFAAAGIPAISSRDLGHFFRLAASLYQDALPAELADNANDPLPPPLGDGSGSEVLVLGLFRQTLTHVRPVAERFHLGPADRQPLYALTAQPSPRSAAEYNELSIKRRDPTSGVWHGVCTSDVEPSLDLARPGHYKVASLTMDAVPVWKRVVSGRVTLEAAESGKGNKFGIWWGDRISLGPIGDAYGLWCESGGEAGTIEAFYVVQQWRGFEGSSPGVVRVSSATSQQHPERPLPVYDRIADIRGLRRR